VSDATRQEFQGKRVLITGGNSGIGRAAAEAFAQRGARVAVVGRDPRTLAETQTVLGEGAVAIQGDVSNLADLDRMVEVVRAGFGGLDVLVVCAGVCPILPIEQVTEQFFDHVIGVNLKGAFFTMQKCAPLLVDGAAVVLVGSSAARKGLGGMSVYGASKAGLRALARTFSAELLPRRIRVNMLSLGVVQTPIVDRLGVPPEIALQLTDNIRRLVPLQRLGETSEVIGALMFLASTDSTYVVGADLQVDGGLTTL
jgi:NAD(P)-dependent dehydrogenase (short-subunit alcohol dehydrogenase family)